MLDEYREVLQYERIQALHGLSDEQINEVIDYFKEFALEVKPSIKLDVVKNDPDDNMFFECAVTGAADFIVSGDEKHVLPVQISGIQVLSPAEFLIVLEEELTLV